MLNRKSFKCSVLIALDVNMNLLQIILRLNCSGGPSVKAQRLCSGLDLKTPVASSALFWMASRSLADYRTTTRSPGEQSIENNHHTLDLAL